MGFEDFGVGVVIGVRLLMGVPCPIWPLHLVALGTLRKTNLRWGESPPIWGRYGGLKFCPKAYFGLDYDCLLYTSDAADDLTRVDLGGRRIIKKKKK